MERTTARRDLAGLGLGLGLGPGLRRRLAASHPRDERGDVPGWVMITVMTVAIVGAIWAVADDQLTAMLRAALDSVGKG